VGERGNERAQVRRGGVVVRPVFARLALLLLCALPNLASAQMLYGPATITSGSISGVVRVTPNGGTETSLGAALAAVGGCPLAGCTFTGPVNTSSALGYQLNGSTALTVDQTNSNVLGGYLSGVGISPAAAAGTVAYTVQGAGSLGAGLQGLGGTFLGFQAGANVTTSNYHVFLGYLAGGNVTTCTTGLPAGFDVGIGYRNLINDSGCENVGIGGQVLNRNTLGHNNIGLGSDVADGITTGSSNFFAGHGSGGTSLTSLTGNNNEGIGDGSLGNIDGAAFSNLCFGQNSCKGDPTSTVTGNNLIAMGVGALGFPGASNQIIAIGQGAVAGSLATPQTGIHLLVMGALAGNAIVGTTHDMVLLGDLSGTKIANGSQRTLMAGSLSGQNCTACSNSILLGYNTGATEVTGNNIILLGHDIDVLSSSATNYMNLGGAIIANTTAPTVTSGFGTSPSVVSGTSSGAFTINVGSGGAATSGVMNLIGNAPHGYACDVTDTTNPASFVTVSVPTSAFQVTLTNYSRTTGAAIAWTASDVLVAKCNGY
jgi:hypothetical protein